MRIKKKKRKRQIENDPNVPGIPFPKTIGNFNKVFMVYLDK